MRIAAFILALLLGSLLNADSLANLAFSSAAEAAEQQKGGKPMREVHDFLKDCGYYFLATSEGDQPRVRPFGTAAIFEGKLYIQTGKKKDVSRQMAKNSKIEICAYDGKGKWLRIQATVENDDNIAAKRFMLDSYPELKGMYSAEDDNTQVLYLKNAKATFYAFDEAPRTVEF